MTMPFCAMSETSSGGVRSSTMWMVSRMSRAGSAMASTSSTELIFTDFGRPVVRQRPLTS